MVELFPEGFEETEHSDGVELAAYTDASGEERLWAAFGTVSADASRMDGSSGGASSTNRCASDDCGWARRGKTLRPAPSRS